MVVCTVRNLLKEQLNSKIYSWLPLIIWFISVVIPLLLCVTLDVCMVVETRFHWDSYEEKCHPILSGLFFYLGLIAMYYHTRDRKPRESALRVTMIAAGMVFAILYLIDIVFLSFWFISMDSEMTTGWLILPLLYIPLSWFYIRYFFRDLNLRIPDKVPDWGQDEFLHV